MAAVWRNKMGAARAGRALLPKALGAFSLKAKAPRRFAAGFCAIESGRRSPSRLSRRERIGDAIGRIRAERGTRRGAEERGAGGRSE
ncbi:unnamed protein product [Amoebophrya sp. A120]|nr:unnamed protein product [Amoebophrya sp. A120]|eukprot:GSA120T00024541001.1